MSRTESAARLRGWAGLIAVATVAAVLVPARAQAYRFIGKYPSHTVLYFNTATQYSARVKAATAAWNTSGVRIRWVAVSRARARVVIKVTRNLPTAGLASVNGGRGLIQLRPDLGDGMRGPAEVRTVATQVIVHEMGHIIGLGHETRTCAIMQPQVRMGCPQPKQGWRFRCRLLERDDLRGAVHLQGGHVRKLTGSPFCNVAPPLPAPGPVTAVPQADPTTGATSAIVISWIPPRAWGKSAAVAILRRRDRCPTGLADKAATVVYPFLPAGSPGHVEQYRDGGGPTGLSAGHYCYLVVPLSLWRQPGHPGSATAEAIVAPNHPPRADFGTAPGDSDPNTVEFFDSSSDPDGDALVSYAWTFGDGGTSAEASPVHTYPGPGTYQVVLTVTDRRGAQGSTTQTVTVDPP